MESIGRPETTQVRLGDSYLFTGQILEPGTVMVRYRWNASAEPRGLGFYLKSVVVQSDSGMEPDEEAVNLLARNLSELSGLGIAFEVGRKESSGARYDSIASSQPDFSSGRSRYIKSGEIKVEGSRVIADPSCIENAEDLRDLLLEQARITETLYESRRKSGAVMLLVRDREAGLYFRDGLNVGGLHRSATDIAKLLFDFASSGKKEEPMGVGHTRRYGHERPVGEVTGASISRTREALGLIADERRSAEIARVKERMPELLEEAARIEKEREEAASAAKRYGGSYGR